MPDARASEMAVFRLKARQVAQQCLYFLYFLEPRRRRSKREHDAPPREPRPRRDAVFADRVLDWLGWALDGKMIDSYRAFVHGNMRALVGVVRAPADSAADPVVAAWEELRDRIAANRFGRDDVWSAIGAAQ